MINKLIIHGGTHKSGSTYIQNCLYQNRKYLSTLGFCYPDVGMLYLGHHKIANWMLGYKHLASEDFLAELRQLDGNIIISSENFSLVDGEQLFRFREAFPDTPIEYILYLREPCGYLYSRWQEYIKHGAHQSLPAFLYHQLSQPFESKEINYDLKIQPAVDAFGIKSVKLIIYDNLMSSHLDIFRYFAEAVIGLKPEQIDGFQITSEILNRSMPIELIEFIRLMNSIESAFGRKNSWLLREKIFEYMRNGSNEISDYLEIIDANLESLEINSSQIYFSSIENYIYKKYKRIVMNSTPGGLLRETHKKTCKYYDRVSIFNSTQYDSLIKLYHRISRTSLDGNTT